MKYAFMSFSTPDLTLAETLDFAAKTGYAGIEPRIAADHKHGIAADISASARAEIKAQVAASEVEIACLATSCKYAEPSKHEEMHAETVRCIDLAADLGAPALRVFGGVIPEGVSRADSVRALVNSFKRLADYAAEKNVVLCMETHDDWCSPTQVAEVMSQVNHPAIAVNWDIMHPVIREESTMEAAFNILRPWIRHVHIHDGTPTSFLPIGEGAIDHRTAVGCLLEMKYTGYISGEWINWEDGYESHLPRELTTLKNYEAEILGAVKK